MIFLIFLSVLLVIGVLKSHDDIVEYMLAIAALEMLIELAMFGHYLFK